MKNGYSVMFKLIINTVLSFILLVSTSGFILSKHYCSGELISVSITYEKDSCCNIENCCHNESEFIQLKTDYNEPSAITIPPIFKNYIDLNLFKNIEIIKELRLYNSSLLHFNPFSPKKTLTYLLQIQSFLL